MMGYNSLPWPEEIITYEKILYRLELFATSAV
jgi:hypothetical protein